MDVQRRREFLGLGRRWIRSCGICSGFFPPIDAVCEQCWARLDQIQNRGIDISQPGRPFALHSLFTWNERGAFWVGGLIHALKGGREVVATRNLAERLSLERGLVGGLGPPAAFLIPPRKPGRPWDHAWLLAMALSSLWDRPVIDPFELLESKAIPQEREQKRLGATDRQERRFHLNEERVSRLPDGVLVFVDDVVTSGATAMAAYMALEDPSRFEVWTLANRPKLAAQAAL